MFSKSKSPYISQKPLEEVFPVYVLQGLPTTQRTAILKSRQTESPSMSRLIETVMAFWLAHHVVGMVSLKAIVQHLMILLKMAQSKTVSHAVWYSRLLPDYVRSRVVRKNATVETFLETVVEELDKKAESMSKKSLTGFKSEEKPDVPRPKAKPSKGAPSKAGASPKYEIVPINKQVCLAHDTANNKICPKGADCPRVHLDTKTSQKDAKAYKEAQDIVHRVKKKTKKGPI